MRPIHDRMPAILTPDRWTTWLDPANEDLASLQKIYDQIDKMEKTAVEVEQYTRFEERFQPFLWAALGCLLLEKILAMTRLGRLP